MTVAHTGDPDAGRAATLEVVREVWQTGDLAVAETVLAPGALWYGSRGGPGCRSRDEVLATLRAAFAGDEPRPPLSEAQLRGDHAVLHFTWPPGAGNAGDRWCVLTFDEAGLICRLQGYDDEAVVEHDLALRAAGPPPDAADRRPAPTVNGLVPFVHVADVTRSLTFYRLLGFEPVDSFAPRGEPVWAFLQSSGASLMLARADAPIDHRDQAVLFYLYAHDLAGLRDHLVTHGVTSSEIVDGTPGPREEMSVADPDGYMLMVARIEPDRAAPG